MKNHGTWSLYKPKKLPPNAPKSTIFAKRDSDGVDWYDYVYKTKAFKEGNAVLAIATDEYGMRVNAAHFEPYHIFPAGHLVLEVEYKGEDPQKHFDGRMYDPETKEFKDVTYAELTFGPKHATN